MDRERTLPGQSVVVERGIIARIGPARTVPIPAGARTIDGTGKFLIPGLADMHVHLASNPENEQRMLLQLFVVNGVTTVLNLRGIPQILDLRSAVAAGRVFGPTIYTAGPYVNEPFVRTADDVEREVVAQRRAGYDFIKLHGDLTREAYARLNAVARREGIRVVGHAPRNLGLAAMFEERQYALAHAEEFLYDTSNSSRNFQRIEPQIPDLARSMVKAGIWLMPNLTAFRVIGLMASDLDAVLARPEVRYLPSSNQQGWGPRTNPYTARFGPDDYSRIMARLELLQKLVRGFQAAGVRMLIGTDAMNTGVVPGFSTHDELEELVVAGLTPFEALRAATANAAEFLAKGQRGTVAVGQRADLVLLDANPLLDITNTRRIRGVGLRGQWLARPDLDAILGSLRSGP
jgi:imidazolonepropionase-like amidohydrolase